MFDNETVTQGASFHHLYIGLGAQTAANAGVAAAQGLTALPDALQRYFGPRAGASFDLARVDDSIDENAMWAGYELQNAYFKVHPTCAHLHGLNDAIAWLIENEAPEPQEIVSVEIATYQAALRYDVHDPTCDLSIRFSARASSACALVHGALDLDTFTFENVGESAVQALMERTQIMHDPSLDAHYPAGRPARVRVTLTSGRVIEKTVIEPLGDCSNPMSQEQKRQKAMGLFSRRYGATASEIVEAVHGLDQTTSLEAVCRLLRSPLPFDSSSISARH